ncbi:hypothetical protein RHMOL_Rhmol12G0054800 [Rhododendron molle]|uniref:Uncharacterized protein n=1 Tax=Rhododendron molle TaxID=49168 RepID=A0ACC0LG93_RHOML|nr:hypothetical protein RHMOL_Rhmol12G0054800 [Rhododendron molle]
MRMEERPNEGEIIEIEINKIEINERVINQNQQLLHFQRRLNSNREINEQDRELFLELLYTNPELFKALDLQQQSLLHLASTNGHIEIVKALIHARPEMCLARDRDGANPLHVAAMRGKVEVLDELFKANPHATRAYRVDIGESETILHICVKYNQLQFLKKLLQNYFKGKDFVNAKDNADNTILRCGSKIREKRKFGGEEEYQNQVKQGEEGVKKFQGAGEKESGKIVKVQAVGNEWLSRSAVGKMRRPLLTQELEVIFEKERVRDIQIKSMGGRFVIITFLNEGIRDEMLKEKWMDLSFEEMRPWNGEQAKDERFVWIACYGMPLNAWNLPSFRAIGCNWGHFIEVNRETLMETSYAMGRILIVTEISDKFEGKIQLLLDGISFVIRVEEEDSFGVVSPPHQVSSSAVSRDGEDDEVDRNDSWKKKAKQLGELAINVGAIILPEDINLYSLLPKSAAPIQFNTLEDSHDESSNSTHVLDSIVQDSLSPLQEKSLESGHPNRQVQPRENQIVENLEQEQEKGLEQEQNSEKVSQTATNSGVIISNNNIRASQVQGINLLVELNPSAVSKSIRSQQYEDSLSKDGIADEVSGYIFDSLEQEQSMI